jgi:hypothetical protein
MKNMMRSFALMAAVGLLFTACSKEDEGTTTQQPLTETTVRDLPADTIIGLSSIGQPFGSGRYTLFSLERNAIVPNSDSATNRWDIGFRGTTIITNSGVSGPGGGGGFVFVGTFQDLKQVPADSTIRVDQTNNLAIPAGSNRGWYVYNAPVNLVTPLPGRVLVFRTATGKFAKVEILNYYKGGVTPPASASDQIKLREQRYYTFRFIIQPDGTGKF